MTPLHAVAISGPDRAVPSIAELAETPGLATPVVVAPGASADRGLVRRVGEHLSLGMVVLLLFQDADEAADFEVKLAAARARAPGGKASAPVRKVRAHGVPRLARPVLVGPPWPRSAGGST